MEPKDEMGLNEIDGLSQQFHEEKKTRNFPGCFKRAVAFMIDEMIIALLSIVVFFPFSGQIESLYQHSWIPAYLLGGFYFAVLESSFWKSQSIGKLIFSMKVTSLKNNNPISPFVSFGRYSLIIFPFFNQAIGGSLTSIVGLNSAFSIIYLVTVGVILSGNSAFMLFHPQKRGLHDVIFGTAVFPTKHETSGKIRGFALRPTLCGVGLLLILVIFLGGMLRGFIDNSDFSDVEQLNTRLQKSANNKNISASYKVFSRSGDQTSFIIEVHVPIPYDKFGDRPFLENVSNSLYPIVKQENVNPKVDTVTVVFHAQKYIGAFPIRRSYTAPKKLSEIE